MITFILGKSTLEWLTVANFVFGMVRLSSSLRWLYLTEFKTGPKYNLKKLLKVPVAFWWESIYRKLLCNNSDVSVYLKVKLRLNHEAFHLSCETCEMLLQLKGWQVLGDLELREKHVSSWKIPRQPTLIFLQVSSYIIQFHDVSSSFHYSFNFSTFLWCLPKIL